jgi:hypothetical protein
MKINVFPVVQFCAPVGTKGDFIEMVFPEPQGKGIPEKGRVEFKIAKLPDIH